MCSTKFIDEALQTTIRHFIDCDKVKNQTEMFRIKGIDIFKDKQCVLDLNLVIRCQISIHTQPICEKAFLSAFPLSNGQIMMHKSMFIII